MVLCLKIQHYLLGVGVINDSDPYYKIVILPCVVASKTSHRALTAPYLPGLAVLCHQSGA